LQTSSRIDSGSFSRFEKMEIDTTLMFFVQKFYSTSARPAEQVTVVQGMSLHEIRKRRNQV
jgi:hypothetical protein